MRTQRSVTLVASPKLATLGLGTHQCTHVDKDRGLACPNIVPRRLRGRPGRKCGVHRTRRQHQLSAKARKKKAKREGLWYGW